MGSAIEEPNMHNPASLELAEVLPETEVHDVDVDVSVQLHGCHQFVWLSQKYMRQECATTYPLHGTSVFQNYAVTHPASAWQPY